MAYPKRLIALLFALVAVAALAACGSDDGSSTSGGGETSESSKPTQPAPTTIVVRDGAPVNGVETLEYSAGEEVQFRVSSNLADEVHVHGYDLMKEVPAGGTVTISFPADIEGIFEVELHSSEEQIAELRVNP